MNGSVVVVGGGAPGEHFVGALRRLDPEIEITLVEERLVGGECSYWACIPTKTMLRPPEVLEAARRTPGISGTGELRLDPRALFAWRDSVVKGRDDRGQLDWLARQRVSFVRGRGKITAPGVVRVGDQELGYDKLVIATGSVPVIPPIPGIEHAAFWTNRDATEATDVPESLLVLGGGPVGCELAQFFARLGSGVTIAQRGGRLLPRIDADAARLVADAFAADGIQLRLGVRVERVEAGNHVVLAGGETITAERILVATGRRPAVQDLGLEHLGIEADAGGLRTDEHMRVADGVWALGDVTGVALFTHVGKYQARIAAADIAGRERRADYRAIPATIFVDPQVATIGTLAGDGLARASIDVTSVARLYTYESPERSGLIKLAADPERGVLVGAVAVGPEAGEWLQQLAVAIRAEVPVDTLLDVIQPFPTFSEGIFTALQELAADEASAPTA